MRQAFKYRLYPNKAGFKYARIAQEPLSSEEYCGCGMESTRTVHAVQGGKGRAPCRAGGPPLYKSGLFDAPLHVPQDGFNAGGSNVAMSPLWSVA